MTRHHAVPPWYRGAAARALGAVLCAGLAGYLAGSQLIEPRQITTTRTVTETPAGCIAALDVADRAHVIALEFGRMMTELHKTGLVHTFEPGGAHDQDSHRFVADMTAAAEAFRADKTACVEGADHG